MIVLMEKNRGSEMIESLYQFFVLVDAAKSRLAGDSQFDFTASICKEYLEFYERYRKGE